MIEVTDSVDYTKVPNNIDRVRLYYLPWRYFQHLLCAGGGYPQAICVPILQLPEDCAIWNVFIQPGRMSVGIVVSHPSFEPVLPGQQVPELSPLGFDSKMFILVGDDKFACNWECVPTSDLRAFHHEVDRELMRRQNQARTSTEKRNPS